MFVIDIGLRPTRKEQFECVPYFMRAEYSVRNKINPNPQSLAILRGANMFFYIFYVSLFCRCMEHCFLSDESIYICGLSDESIYMCVVTSNMPLFYVCYWFVDWLILSWYLLLTGFTIMSNHCFGCMEWHQCTLRVDTVCFGAQPGLVQAVELSMIVLMAADGASVCEESCYFILFYLICFVRWPTRAGCARGILFVIVRYFILCHMGVFMSLIKPACGP